MRDRLRAVSCSIEMIDQIVEWLSIGTVGPKYGQRNELDALTDQLDLVCLTLELLRSRCLLIAS